MNELDFYIQIVKTLDEIEAAYMIVGAFGGLAFGIHRTTADVDILVDLNETQIAKLVAHFPPPRYYADAEMMRDSMQRGLMFDILDTNTSAKADLVPLLREPDYQRAFARRIRQTFRDLAGGTFEAWCAQPTDIIIGKLRAWTEGRSSKHPNDIYQMLIFLFTELQVPDIELADIEEVALELGDETLTLWHDLFVRASITVQKLKNHKD